MDDYSISFPNIGLYLSHVGKSVTIFGFEIAYYGIVIAVGMLLGVSLVMYEAKRTGQNTDEYFNATMLALLFGVVGARLYYVVFSWELYRDHFWQIFNIRQGGLAIYGGILGAVLTVILYTKRKNISFWRMADTMCLGVLVGQILGRWGNFFNREAFGDSTDSLLAMRLPVSAVRSSDLTESLMAHISDGYIQVHPTFFYESVWNLVLFVILFLYRRHTKFRGELFGLYVFGYGIGRFWIEGLRTDQLLIPGLEVPVSQALSLALVVFSAAALVVCRVRGRRTEPFIGKKS